MKRDGLNKKEFFAEISKLADFCDERLVENVYYAMIKVISRQLKAGKRINLPDWGKFYIHNAAPRRGICVHTGKIRSLGMKKCVRFHVDYKVKAYFHQIE